MRKGSLKNLHICVCKIDIHCQCQHWPSLMVSRIQSRPSDTLEYTPGSFSPGHVTRYIMTRAQSAPRVSSPSSPAGDTPMVVCTTRCLSTFNRCQHNTTIFRTASSVTIADVSWRISSAVHRGTSSAASASKYVSTL